MDWEYDTLGYGMDWVQKVGCNFQKYHWIVEFEIIVWDHKRGKWYVSTVVQITN